MSLTSRRLRKLRMKHIMDWDEFESAKLQRSIIYRIIAAASPRILFWILIIVVAVLSIMEMKP